MKKNETHINALSCTHLLFCCNAMNLLNKLKIYFMRLSTLSLCFVIGSTLVLSSCQKTSIKDLDGLLHPNKDNTYIGPEVRVGNGQARTFVTLNGKNVPQEIGVVFMEEALSGLPATNTLFTFELNHKAIEATPFEHVVVGLNPGHALPPSGSIGPHFDVRFFMITNEERLTIPAPPAPGFDVYPPAGYLPDGVVPYVTTAQIGRNWPSGSFVAGQTVNHTMVWGTYNGAVIFINPAVTLATLSSGQSYSVAYPQPQYFAKHGYYPTRYNIYKDEQGRHIVSLSNFVWR